MQALPYLNFNGTCREAFEFYAKTLGGNIVAVHTYGEMPDGYCPPGAGDRVMHVRLDLGDGTLMGSDCPPNMPSDTPQGFAVSIHPSSVAEGERIFNAFADGGSVTMPFAPTFWAAGFGMVTDRYGTPWMINIDLKS
jgi:PhnB protein